MTSRATVLGCVLATALGAGVPGRTAAGEAGPSALRLLLPAPLIEAEVAREAGRDTLAVVLREESEEGAEEGEARRRAYVYDPAARTLVPRGGPLPDGAPELATGSPDGIWLGLARYGELELLPLAAGAPPTDGPAATLALPRRAERASWGLRLTSPPVQALPDPDGAAGEPPCFATEPEAHGRRRLRVLLLCPGREPEELWSLLPGAETVTGSRFGLLDGATALAVLTREKLGLFVKQDLRVFALAGSRNRVGAGPVLAARTDCPLWRGSEIAFRDADGDGGEDLVVVCRTGLVDQELRVEVYRHRRAGEPGGAFDPRPRVTRIEGDFGSWHYGADWNGDGTPDLLTLRGAVLQVYTGSPRGRPVDARASRHLALPGKGEEAADTGGEEEGRAAGGDAGADGDDAPRWRGGPELVAAGDLDGDGRPELVVHRAREGGGELLVLTP